MLAVYPNFEVFDFILFILSIPVINISFDLKASWFAEVKWFSADFNKTVSTDKVHIAFNFLLWRSYRALTILDQFQQPRHILAEHTHDLHTFFILCRFPRAGAMNNVPVVGGRYQHLGVAHKIVQLVKCRQAA